jgi:hypothetical protein
MGGKDTSKLRVSHAAWVIIAALSCAVAWSVASGQAAGAESPGSTPPLGHIFFFDDFSNRLSGWATDSLPSGVRFAYGDAEYLITPARARDDFAGAPYAEQHLDLIQRVDVGFPIGPTHGAEGGGLFCARPDLHGAAYQFTVWPDGGWGISRRDKAGAPLVRVVSGELIGKGAGAGATVAVVAVCQTTGTGSTSVTHLSLFIQGVKVADLDDPWSVSASTGWRGGLLAAGGRLRSRSPVRFTHYSLASTRILADPSPAGSPATGPIAARPLPSTTVRWAAFGLGVVLVAALVVLLRRRRSGRADLISPPMPPPPS